MIRSPFLLIFQPSQYHLIRKLVKRKRRAGLRIAGNGATRSSDETKTPLQVAFSPQRDNLAFLERPKIELCYFANTVCRNRFWTLLAILTCWTLRRLWTIPALGFFLIFLFLCSRCIRHFWTLSVLALSVLLSAAGTLTTKTNALFKNYTLWSSCSCSRGVEPKAIELDLASIWRILQMLALGAATAREGGFKSRCFEMRYEQRATLYWKLIFRKRRRINALNTCSIKSPKTTRLKFLNEQILEPERGCKCVNKDAQKNLRQTPVDFVWGGRSFLKLCCKFQPWSL